MKSGIKFCFRYFFDCERFVSWAKRDECSFKSSTFLSSPFDSLYLQFNNKHFLIFFDSLDSFRFFNFSQTLFSLTSLVWFVLHKSSVIEITSFNLSVTVSSSELTLLSQSTTLFWTFPVPGFQLQLSVNDQWCHFTLLAGETRREFGWRDLE